jgi:dGTPase
LRTYFEELEFKNLKPYAVKSKLAKGKKYQEAFCENRTCYQRDRDRIIHSKAFRRLKHKTQVFVASESDHYRSRLSHTLEVTQISRHIARMLSLNEDLAEAVALAHDLGHTPFGHAGERELNKLMLSYGGFEHNKQSLRIVDLLESKYPGFPGINLTLEVRAGLIKKKNELDESEQELKYQTLEAQVCDIADEIAYNHHDLDDGLAASILDEGELASEVDIWIEMRKKLLSQHPNLDSTHIKSLVLSSLIASQISDVTRTTVNNIKTLGIQTLDDLQHINEPVVSFSEEMKAKNKQLREFLFKHYYTFYEIYRMNKQGQNIIKNLFDAFLEDSKLLPSKNQKRIGEWPKERVVCDYVSGMTDIYAQKTYKTIFY